MNDHSHDPEGEALWRPPREWQPPSRGYSYENWYEDPAGSGRLRWWTGKAWTQATRDKTIVETLSKPALMVAWLLILVGMLVAGSGTPLALLLLVPGLWLSHQMMKR